MYRNRTNDIGDLRRKIAMCRNMIASNYFPIRAQEDLDVYWKELQEAEWENAYYMMHEMRGLRYVSN